jgi:hypothetical protein
MKPLLGSGTSYQEDTRTYTEDGDHERYAHYSPKDEVMYSLVEGVPIMALCGKIWIPNRDPKKFPICPTCKEIYAGMQSE